MDNNDYAGETPETMLIRLVDENGWEWRTAVKVINRSFHTDYSISELKRLYKRVKSAAAAVSAEL